MHDILTEEDIITLVHQFYGKVRKDALLGPIFEKVINGNWDHHLGIMCDFWSTMLLYSGRYPGDPMSKHIPMPIKKEHFDTWITLFKATVDEHFSGPTATGAKQRAQNIANIMKAMKQIPLQ